MASAADGIGRKRVERDRKRVMGSSMGLTAAVSSGNTVGVNGHALEHLEKLWT
jgi:hypothetical protein